MIVRIPFTVKWKIKRVKPKARLYSKKEQAVFSFLKGEQYQLQDMSIHHMLPLALFPDLKNTADNFLLVCNDCHRAIHNNAYLTIHYIWELKPCVGNL